MNVKTRHGAFWFLTFIDGYSRHGYIYLLYNHSEALDYLKHLATKVDTQIEIKIKN